MGAACSSRTQAAMACSCACIWIRKNIAEMIVPRTSCVIVPGLMTTMNMVMPQKMQKAVNQQTPIFILKAVANGVSLP